MERSWVTVRQNGYKSHLPPQALKSWKNNLWALISPSLNRGHSCFGFVVQPWKPMKCKFVQMGEQIVCKMAYRPVRISPEQLRCSLLELKDRFKIFYCEIEHIYQKKQNKKKTTKKNPTSHKTKMHSKEKEKNGGQWFVTKEHLWN